MLDIKKLRDDFEVVCKKVRTRCKKYEQLDGFKEIDTLYRKVVTEIQDLNSKRNQKTKEISKAIAEGNKKLVADKQKLVKQAKAKIDKLQKQAEELEIKLKDVLLSVPNIPHESVILGEDETKNKEIHKWGEPTKFNFKPKTHWDLAKSLHLYDIDRSIKICGSRYILYTGLGARLIRALQAFTLDLNIKAGFCELLPPVIVKPSALVGTGQLPKFEEDLYKLREGSYLSPTGEVQMTNFYADEILDYKELPKHFTCNTACFRSEAGSAGKDVKGVIRQHQFYKTEMVIIADEKTSWDEHEFMTRQAEKILETLNLPYRRIMLCTGDMGFSAAKTYDLEVWLPSYNSYKEISSCSNCTDFQARNMKLRYRDKDGKIKFCHTLNGSGLAIDRLWAAIVENYQQKDGSIKIPEPLLKYFNGEKFIK